MTGSIETARPEFGAAIAVEGKRFGDEIPLTDGKPQWLPDDMEVLPCSGDDLDGHSRMWSCPYEANDVKVWPHIEAIRLEVPRYDFVYLALERGMVPYFGQGKPSDADGKDVLYATFVSGPREAWVSKDVWPHRWGSGPLPIRVIGYHAISAALPLAHPAAPQGEGLSHEHWMALTMLAPWLSHNGWETSAAAVNAALAALAPAAIASGREGAE